MRKMAIHWAALLLFLGAVAAAPTAVTPTSYEQVVASAVDTYNQQQNPEYAFRLLEAEPQPDWDSTGETTQAFKFSVKETVCRGAEQTDVSQCDYKEDGVDRDCSGFYSTQQRPPPVIIVHCEDVGQELLLFFFLLTHRIIELEGVYKAIESNPLLNAGN